MPVFSFWLPLYAFWHFDDFSWGSTRLVVGDDGKKKIVAQGEEEVSLLHKKKSYSIAHSLFLLIETP